MAVPLTSMLKRVTFYTIYLPLIYSLIAVGVVIEIVSTLPLTVMVSIDGQRAKKP